MGEKKPKFDPSKPFEVAEAKPAAKVAAPQGPKPKFDPAQHFEEGDPMPAPADPFPSAGPGGINATEAIFKLLNRPQAALTAGIAEAQKRGTLGDKLSAAADAAGEQLTSSTPPTAPGFGDIVTTDLANQRGIPQKLAEEVGENVELPMSLVYDPLNAIPLPGIKGAQGVKGALDVAADAKGITELVPDGDFFKISDKPKVSAKDKLITTAFGPGEEAVAAYRADPGLINKAAGIGGMKAKVDKAVKGLRSKVTEKTQIVQDLKGQWDEAYRSRVDDLKAQRPPSDRAPDVTAALENLKSEVSRQSGEAFRILDDAGITIPTSNLKGALQLEINQFKATPKITPEGRAAVARLEQMRKNMDDLPPELTGSQAKEIIQEMDAARQASARTGEYFDKEEQIKQLFRGTIDAKLKKLPAYRNAMAFLADDTKLLKEASKRFGDERQLVARLNQLGSSNAGPDRELLSRLSDRLGLGLDESIDSYVEAQRLLKNRDLLEKMRHSLPEGQRHKAALDDLDMVNDTVDRVMRKLGPDSTENVIKSLLRNGAGEETAIENAKAIAELEELTGVSLKEELTAEKLKRAFEGGRPHGARAVTMGGDIGEAAAVSLAQAGAEDLMRKAGPVGRALGSVYFAYVDKYGGQMARKAIDKDLAAKAMAVKANGTNMPVKSFLANWATLYPALGRELLRPDSQLNVEGEMVIDDPAMLQEYKKAVETASQDEMDSVSKAKALSELHKSGKVMLKLNAKPLSTPENATRDKVFGGEQGLQDLIKSLERAGGT